MANNSKPRRPTSSNVPADGTTNSTEYSLSFAGLVCVQDQQLKLRPDGHPRPPPPPPAHLDLGFEFGNAASGFAAASKVTPADVLFSNGHLLPLENQNPSRSSTQSRAAATLEDFLPQSYKAAAGKPGGGVSKERSIGRRVFKSFTAPCRSCHAVEPSLQTLPRESAKSQ